VEEVLGSPSGRLFVERARAVSSTFSLTEANATAIASICWRLAGIPLALELAAAKAKFLDPKMLLSRLDRALVDERGTRPAGPPEDDARDPRLEPRSALEPERSCSGACQVFAGGFTLEARRLWARREARSRGRARSPRDISGAVAGRGAAA
jgi:predicted ATPase